MPPVDALAQFQPAVRDWFRATFAAPSTAQALGWPVLASRESALLLAPTGSGKTLAAFLTCIDRLMFAPLPPRAERCRIVYVSPLKALAVDVERNLRGPLAGIANIAAGRGDAYLLPSVAVRTGDTPAAARARFRREPADILITTPESLYLLLTSGAREALRSVDTVIVDEIHALVPTKRGAHLALSIERLEALTGRPLQRIGLSATQRPLQEVARFLGGATAPASAPPSTPLPPLEEGAVDASRVGSEFAMSALEAPTWRPVTVVDAGSRKALTLRIEVPVEDMAKPRARAPPETGTLKPPAKASIWAAIHPRLVELVRQHTSTLLFVNNRRTAERLAAALNELAGETLVRAHHGSIAREQRLEIEEALKAGNLRGLVATSSLELGIDMGAIDLVVQIEAPPSVAAGLQRIGRAGHQLGAPSSGILFPKYRADLVACAALTQAMHAGDVEPIRYPRNPLDVLAQQLVAMVALETWPVDALYARVRQAAPYVELSRPMFDAVLDMLAGRYASEAFSDLRPRITWDRVANTVSAREGSQRIAIANGGTIPDRGLYGVFLSGGTKGHTRVGELDEEMVFECKPGEMFLLGASTWRIEEITHDRVLVSPAPGQPGKMPFWRGDAASRPSETGQAIGTLVRELLAVSPSAALMRLERDHDLDVLAASKLLRYLEDQRAATEVVPDDRTLVIERTRDEVGDWRVCLLSPLGGRIHAPWAMAILAKVRKQLGVEVEATWTNDGIVLRFPESDLPPDPALFLPRGDEVEKLLLGELGSTSLFAARFREAASRALLLPRRRAGTRTPLWVQRKRASDLLAVASRFGGFPMLLETYRECLRDVFDMPALAATLQSMADGRISVRTVDTSTPSPFAASLLFGFVANFIYEGDAPLAERRAQALSVDQAQLRELLGEAELRELLDADVLAQVESELQRTDARSRARSPDAVHDLLLRIGDLTESELLGRCVSDAVAASIEVLVDAGRVVPLELLGERRYVAVEDAVRFRDALGVRLPTGLPEALLVPVREALAELVARYARTHGPFTLDELSRRFGLSHAVASAQLAVLVGKGALLEGAFRPGGTQREWCDVSVLASLRQRSLAKLRRAVEPVEPAVLGRLFSAWHGLVRKRAGLDAILDAVERLQGCPLPASVLETDILPSRVAQYMPGDLDTLAAAGEVVWVGVEPLGGRDGRLALYLPDQLPRLLRPDTAPAAIAEPLSERAQAVLAYLHSAGASFFGPLHQGVGGGFPLPTVEALWSLAWKGLITNDTFRALRGFLSPPGERKGRRRPAPTASYRSRRAFPPSAEGRWSLLETRAAKAPTPTEWSSAVAQQLLARYGLVTRAVAQSEGLVGGFSAVYDVLKALEESGRIRRGYFVSGVGATQFVLPPVVDLLRSLRAAPEPAEVVLLAATDPANPYGAVLPWRESEASEPARAARAVGAHVVLVDGALAAWIGRGGRQAWVWLPASEPDRSRVARGVAEQLAVLGRTAQAERHGGLVLAEINGQHATQHVLALFLTEAGFTPSSLGFHLRRPRPSLEAIFGAKRDS